MTKKTSKKQKRLKKILFLKTKYNKSYWYFVNCLFFSLMKDGKKEQAWKHFCKILLLIRKISKLTFLLFFKHIYEKLYSNIYIRIQHLGRIRYKIPAISYSKSVFLARTWLLNGAYERTERTLVLKIFAEFKELNEDRGNALLKKNKYYEDATTSISHIYFLRYVNKKRRKNKKNDNFFKKKRSV